MTAPETLKAARLQLLDAEILKIQRETRHIDIEIERMEHNDRMSYASADEHQRWMIWGPINAISCATAMTHFDQWSRERPGSPMTLLINSPGGSIVEGLALFDFIQVLRDSGHHFTTVAVGMAASMGGVLLQAGDTRIAYKNAMVLIHEASGVTQGKMTELKDEVAFMDRLQDKVIDILAARSVCSRDEIKTRWERRDWWIDATEALELGFVDEVR